LFSFQRPINAATFETDAIDVQLTYRNEIPSQWFGAEAGAWGDFSTRLLYTFTNSYEFAGSADDDPSDFIGELGFPEHRFNLQLNYFNGPFSLNYRVIVLSEQDLGVTDSCTQDDVDFVNSFFGNPPDSFCYTPGSPWYDEHSISARYTFDDNGWEVFGGIDNLFDEFVYIPSGYPGNVTGTETNGGVFDALGRRYYLGLRKTW